jgi:uncharacterized protein YukE
MAVSVSVVEATNPEALTGAAVNLGGKVAQLDSTLEAQREAIRDLKGGWQGTAADAAFSRAERDLAKQAGFRNRLAQAQQVLQIGGTHLAQARSAVLGIVNALRGQGWQVSDDGVATPPPTLPPVLKNTAQAWTAAVQRLLTIFGDIDKQMAGGLPKFSPLSDGPQFAGGDKKEETERWARETVEGALNGDAEEAAKVDEVLDSITDDQIAGNAILNTEQQMILAQMGYQTHNMSLQQLSEVRDRLGDKKGILANSWQMLSNGRVQVPKITTTSEIFPEVSPEMVYGSKDLLPTSIQETLDAPGLVSLPNPEGYPLFELPTENDLKTVAGFVADGDQRFQYGTFLDDGLMTRGAEILERGGHTNEIDGVVQDIFKSAGRDAIIDHKFMTGDGGREFLDNVATHAWTDNGAAARTLTDWVDDAANGNNFDIDRRAGETAYAVADYLGDERDKLAGMGTFGGSGLGAVNPELVQGYADALGPYQEAMIGDRTDPATGFGMLDGQLAGEYSHARNVFSVIDTDPTAAANFNQKAYESILQYQQDTENAVRNGGPADGTALGHSGRMLGVLNGAADMAEVDSSYDIRREALNAAIGEMTGKLPVIGSLGHDYLLDKLLGQTSHEVPTYNFTEIDNMQKWAVASEIFEKGAAPTNSIRSFIIGDTLMTPDQVLQTRPGEIENYYQALRDYSVANGWGDALVTFGDEYEQGKGSK